MRIYLFYSQFKAIRKSVIISDLILIVLTAIAFYYSFFVDIVHFFIFAISCFFVKLVANLFVKEIFRFPSYIHLIAPFPVVMSFVFLIISFMIYVNFFMGIVIFCISYVIVIILLFLIKYICFEFFNYKIDYYQFIPHYHLYKYYNLIKEFIGNNYIVSCLMLLQMASFYSIAFSFLLILGESWQSELPVREFVFFGLFVPLLSFAFFNLIEIIVFLFAKFPKSGQFFEYKEIKNIHFMSHIIIACFLAYFIANIPYMAYPYVRSYLGSQYESTMEKLIEQKRNYQ